jgi:hypothetical protein
MQSDKLVLQYGLVIRLRCGDIFRRTIHFVDDS